ncbi:hypothetical protein PARPLA_02951 [Rhodobacteraceae bacterium THAF1]|uniref:hypothetical protein n=1 Tax=Palleronia sp. THAF1 TaxID=2587842 RepID=UPI000F407534|nr:hypothetical protein [Palleronia sp. THAF1]QFU08352.1 hypothetical protein FIU81_06665 [Palleronia sp. THAF1]VDC29026.1 hypothetical protein PARPLA_02951 [Rhodobacteraceae bacterium THAF1]
MTRLIILVALAASLTGCGRFNLPNVPFTNRIQPSEPLPFKTNLAAARGAQTFQVSVAQGAADLEAVRESVRFPATNHCMRYYGSSQIDWVSAAGDPNAWVGQPTESGATVYSGRCDPR